MPPGESDSPSAYFLGGTIVLNRVAETASPPPYFQWHNAKWRCPAVHYRLLRPWLVEQDIRNTVPRWRNLTLTLDDKRDPHPYQAEALQAWQEAGRWGSVVLPTGAVLIDTPGMRELGLTDDASGVETAFADISDLAEGCRFNDCRHEGEPGCAVQAALADGTLSAERWESYRKLQREVAAYEARQNPVLAAERRRQWKVITKSVRNSSKVTGKPLS